MIRVYSKDDAIEIDKKTTLEFGISSDELIKRACLKLSERFDEKFRELRKNTAVIFLIGPGNNGKDGLGMSELLKSNGYNCENFIFSKEYLDNSLVKEVHPKSFNPSTEVLKHIRELQGATKTQIIIVDALFGIGLSRSIPIILHELFFSLNSICNIIVVSIDIPSGINATTGLILGTALKAKYTFTIGKPKSGLFLNYGGTYSGFISVLDIGFPKELEEKLEQTPTFLFTKKEAVKLLPPLREPLTNKTKQGHLWVLAGSNGMTGALTLTTEAAARMGVGYVSYSTLASSQYLPKVLPDFLQKPWPSLSQKQSLNFSKISSIIIGPGLGKSKKVRKLFENLMDEFQIKKSRIPNIPILIDADGINALKQTDKFAPNWIITPHAGELSRLLNVPSREIENHRIYYAQLAAKQQGCIVVLKGFRTIVADRNHQVIIYSGHPVLAKAGTGDVLSGFIGGLLGQGYNPFDAACLGAFLHGALGTRYVKKYKNDFTLLASDLKYLLPELIRELRTRGEKNV
jgi:NAD(P)H-hydrate epimerase